VDLKMKILLFEYFTASYIDDPSIISEAKAMIESILIDLKGLDETSEIYLLVFKEFVSLFDKYDYVNIIIIDDDLKTWLKKNVSKFNQVMFIAAESENILYDLTKIIENQKVKILGSNSKSILKCSNKYKTYKTVENIVKQAKTIEIAINNNWEIAIKKILDFFNKSKHGKLIVKPIYGVDCQDIIIISNEKEIFNLKKQYESQTHLLIQEFIEGPSVSVSLISDEKQSLPISLNKQIITINDNKLRYLGGETPFKHALKKKAYDVAKTVTESIKGIKGFVGVDLILDEENNEVYFLEINSRFTTSYVGLSKISNINIATAIVKLLNNQIKLNSLKFEYNKKIKFIKKGKILEINLIK
jgi:predicted ATP-grasp superfamily ATP-dependent carboligase